MGLKLRLIVVLMIPLTLVGGVYGLVRVAQERAELLQDNARSLGATMKAIQIAVHNALADRPLADIRGLVTDLVQSQESFDRVRVFDRELTPIIVSRRRPLDSYIPETAIRRVFAAETEESLYRREERGPVLFYLAPIQGPDGSISAVMEMTQLAEAVETRVRSALHDVWIRLAVLLTSVAALTAVVLQREVLRPLSRLLHGIESLAVGRRGPPLHTGRRDEFGRVAGAFNAMADSLEAAQRRIAADTARTLDLEQQLRQAESLAVAGKLATGFAHEVGTPLNIISGRAEFLLETLAADDPRRRDLCGIIAQIERIATIIHSQLDVVRPRPPELRPLAVTEVTGALLPLVAHAARRHDVALAATVPDDLPLVLGDRDQLQQVLLNLLVNALEATPADGRVDLVATRAPHDGRSGIRVTVSDTGPGIRPELAETVFKPFFTTKPRGRGAGLGLAISRDIAKAHGGELTVVRANREGATFVLWLPAAEPGA